IIMPLAGITAGKLLSSQFEIIALIIGASILIVLGMQMVIGSFQTNTSMPISPVGFGLILFATSVSLDSFSAGMSLGMIGTKTMLTVLSIGISSMILSWLGL